MNTQQDEQLIREITTEIRKLPKSDYFHCEALIKQFRTLIEENGTVGMLAFALVGAEMQSKG